MNSSSPCIAIASNVHIGHKKQRWWKAHVGKVQWWRTMVDGVIVIGDLGFWLGSSHLALIALGKNFKVYPQILQRSRRTNL
jgi:hypothetical protein